MPSTIPTSFVPKQPVRAAASAGAGGVSGIYFIFALVAFLVSLLLAGGMFAYGAYLEREKDVRIRDLASYQGVVREDTANELSRLSTRMNVAETLLNNHVYFSSIFSLLETLTTTSLRFTNAQIALLPDGSASLALSGVARNFNAIAFEAEVLGRDPSIQSPVFSNLEVREDGNVSFSMSATVSARFLRDSSRARATVLNQASTTAPPVSAEDTFFEIIDPLSETPQP